MLMVSRVRLPPWSCHPGPWCSWRQNLKRLGLMSPWYWLKSTSQTSDPQPLSFLHAPASCAHEDQVAAARLTP